MGYYIEIPGSNFNKAATIVREHGGELLSESPTSYAAIPVGKALIVVVDNGYFEAAGFCYNECEFRVFASPQEFRPRQYVLLDRVTAEQLSGYTK